MSDERYKLNLGGARLSSAGLDPRLERVLHGLGLASIPQLYGVIKSSPEAIQKLVEDFDVDFDTLSSLVNEVLTAEEKARLDVPVPVENQGMGANLFEPHAGNSSSTIIRRDSK